MSKTYTPAETVEKDFVNLVKLELDDIKNTFFKIGFRLKEAQQFMYYKKLGFKTIEECAEELFGFKKSTTYDLINIARAFYDPQAPMRIREEYRNYSQSQLVLFTQINIASRNFIRMASPNDTIKDLRTAKRYWKMYQLGKIKGIDIFKKTTIKEFISEAEEKLGVSQALPEPKPKEENSGCPENNETVPDLIEVQAEETKTEASDGLNEEKTEDPKYKKADIEQTLIDSFVKRYKLMSYKTMFDPDNKGFGLRVLPTDIAAVAISTFKDAALKNHTEFEHAIENIIIKFLDKYNYEIILHGRKQGHKALAGNIANNLLDEFTGVKEDKK